MRFVRHVIRLLLNPVSRGKRALTLVPNFFRISPRRHKMFGTFGFQELVIILAIILILFGGSRLPKMMGGLGEGIRNFKKLSNSIVSPLTRNECVGTKKVWDLAFEKNIYFIKILFIINTTFTSYLIFKKVVKRWFY